MFFFDALFFFWNPMPHPVSCKKVASGKALMELRAADVNLMGRPAVLMTKCFPMFGACGKLLDLLENRGDIRQPECLMYVSGCHKNSLRRKREPSKAILPALRYCCSKWRTN